MKNKFLSKSVPRGTRTIWRYLGALFLLFTFAIGNVWAAYDVLFNGYSNTTKDNYYKSYTVGTKTVTVTTSQSISSSSGDYYVQLGSAASDASTNYISVVANEYIESVSFLMTGNGADKALIPALLCWNTAYDSSNKTYADSAIVHASQTVSAKGFSNAEWLDFDLSESSFKEVRVFKQAKNIVVKTAAKANFPASDAQTLQVYGVRIKLRSAAATYTVTVNPNGGSTSTEGWTLSEGSYVKSGIAKDASVTLPTMTKDDYTFAGWKDNHDNAITSPITITKDTTLVAQWASSAATQYNISYTNTKGATNTNPDTYYEGTGIASFTALADVTDFHFTGWDPASISSEATGDQTIIAQWVAAYNVTFSAGAGSGTVPSSFQKWEGGKFNLPGQGSMTAPAGKAFDGWKANGAGDKLAADAEYTMGNAAVEFVAQWKAAPQTIFHWRADAGTTTTDAVNGTTTGGTVTLRSTTTDAWGTESVTYNASVAADMKATSTNEMKSGKNAVYLELALTSGTFQEDDTIYVTGYNTWGFSTSSSFTSWDVDSIVTGATAKGNVKTGYGIIKPGVNAAKIYVRRGIGSGSGIAAIKVIRPAERPVASTAISLSDLKVNNHSISSDSLAILTTAPAYALTLKDEYVTAPEIKFNEHKVITYADELLPATKVTDKVYTVTATLVDGNWQAQQEIDGNTYTVNAPKQSSVKLAYYDGATKLGEETVGIGGHPAEYAAKQSKDYATFVAWYNNSDLAEEHKIANIAELVVNEATNVYGKWTPAYATSINIEQWVLDHGTVNNTFRAELTARNYQYTSLNNLDSLNDDPSKPYRNYAYLGQKVNKTDSEIKFLLKSGSTLNVRFGHLGSDINVVIGSADPVALTSADYANDAPGNKVYEYTATADVIVKFQCDGTSTSVFKQIMIDEPIADVVLPAIVTLDANGGTYTGESSVKYTGTALVIGDATPADEYQEFAGWFDGDDQIDASGYVPTKNVTLVAHYSNKKYTVTYVGGEGATGSMDPVQVAWGDDYTALVCGFAKENHSFVKWTVAGVDAISEIAAGSAFVMPKGNVTLTAQWANDLLVARIGDDYYESLPLAVAAAIASEETTIEIQLLAKDGGVIEGSGVKIPTANKTITIDFNGMKYIAGDPAVGSTGTETQAFQLLMGNNITLKNGAIACKAGSNVKMLIQNYSNLTLKNIRLEGENLNIAASGAYTLSNNNGAVVIGNGTEVIAKENGIAFDVCYYASYPSVSVTVENGASIDGKIEMSMSNGKQNVEENCQLIITGGEFENFSIDHTNIPEANVNAAISAGTFDAPVENLYCAENYVPATISAGVYSVEPKTGVEIIGVVTTGGTNKTVTGLYKGDASVNLDDDQKIGSGKYIYVTLASGYTFEETDVLVVDLKAKSDLSGGTKALEITTGVGNIDGDVWKSIAFDDYTVDENTISLEGIAAGQTSIGLKRSANQNAWVNGLKVYRVIYPTLTAITINGNAAVKGEGNTFAITLPEATTDLANLTVEPTIVRNAAHATTPEAVVGGSWAEGANTYRVMDKDGDYTDYTITITLQGQAPAPVITTQPADVAYCAGSEPTLTVEATGDELHYAWFKEAGETDEAVGEDAASYTIASAGTYYVVVTNHVDGKLDASVTSANADVTLNVAAAITTQPTNKRDVVAGSEVTLSVVATNATGYQWYSCEDAEKHGAAAISGAEAANYVFTCNANGFYYCVVGNACGEDLISDVVSVKLEPEGCNTFASKPAAEPYNYEQTGEWTFYYVDSNGADKSTDNVFKDGKNFDDEDVIVADTRRFALKFEKDVESVILYGVGGNDKSFTKVSVSDEMKKNTYTELTATATKTDLTSQQHIFTIEDMIIPAGKYAWFELSGSLKFFKICYTAALAMPKLPTTLGNQELCAGAAYEEFDATITNAAACEGTVAYKWYETTDTENPVATTAKFTPSAEGTYYVVVTHSAAGHITRTVQSDNLTVAHFDALTLVSNSGDVFQHMGTEATLSVVATGKNVAYVWYTCSNAAGDDAEAIVPAETESSLTIASVAEGVQYYKVVISHDCDATTLSHVFKVEGWNQLEQVDVTATTTWDMTNVSANAINLKNDYNPSKQNERLLLANIEGVNNNASFNSQALMFEGQHIGRTESDGVKHLAGRYVQFNVTVPGAVFVTFASNGNNARTIAINGKKCARTTSGTAADKYITYALAVEPGSVEIIGYEGENANQYIRISKIEFKAEYSYHRENLNPSYLGTLCWTNNAVLGGGTLYEFAGKNEYNYLVFDEVEENRLEAGKPYIFMPENGNTEIRVYNTDNEDALTEDQDPVNHMYGTITGKTLVPGQNDNMYYFSASHIWAVKDFTVSISIPANCCYVDYEAVLNDSPAPAPAPGRRRVAMGVQGTQVATGCENLNVSDKPVKMIINGQLFILRGEKMYDAKGQLVK